MIAVGIFAHRRGFNVAVYVTAALFLNVFAWICIAFETKSKVIIAVPDMVPLSTMQGSPNYYQPNAPGPYNSDGRNINYPSDQKYAEYALNPNMQSPNAPSAQGSYNPYNPGPPPPYTSAPPLDANI